MCRKTTGRNAHENAMKLRMITARHITSPTCGLIIEATNRIAKTTLRTSFKRKSTNGNGLSRAKKQCPSNQTTPAMTNPAMV